MKRRGFIGIALAAAAVASAKNISAELPSWVDSEIDAAKKRFDAWKNGRKCAVFVAITDLHSGIDDVARWRHTYKHILYANRAAERLGADAVINLGDWGLEYPVKREHNGEKLLDTVLDCHSRTKIPTLFCVGNHDHYRRIYSNEYLGRKFMPFCKAAVFGENGDYGFLDLPEKSCRVFFLNSSEQPLYYGFSQKQLEFFRKNLTETPDGWAAFVCTHYCVDILGSWLPIQPHFAGKSGDEFRKIMEDHVASGGRLAANLTGDSHFDRTFSKDGVNIFVSQGYGTIEEKDRPKDVKIEPLDLRKNMLAELVAIDADAREIKIFRIGAGRESRDRGAKF